MKALATSSQGAFGPLALQGEKRGEICAQPFWLTEAVATQIHATRGTVKRIKAALGVEEREVYRVADINDPKPLKAHWIPTICQETGSFLILDILEARVGRRAFLCPPAHPDHGEFFDQTARCFCTLSDAAQSLPEILRDGVINPAERAEFLALAREAQAQLARLIDLVETKAADDAQKVIA